MPRECVGAKKVAITVLALLTYDQIGHLMRGMKTQHPIRTILNKWPSRQELADDLKLAVVVVHRWHQRASIPAKYDTRLLDAASARNIPLLWRELMDARASSADQHGHNNHRLQEGNAA
jgi:hypothetical protein